VPAKQPQSIPKRACPPIAFGPQIQLIGAADYLTDFGCVAVNNAELVLAAYRLLAALRDDTPAVLDMARFRADGKNRTALLSAQAPPGGTVAGFRWLGGTGCATAQASPLRN
jgi:hypothetical protein